MVSEQCAPISEVVDLLQKLQQMKMYSGIVGVLALVLEGNVTECHGHSRTYEVTSTSPQNRTRADWTINNNHFALIDLHKHLCRDSCVGYTYYPSYVDARASTHRAHGRESNSGPSALEVGTCTNHKHTAAVGLNLWFRQCLQYKMLTKSQISKAVNGLKLTMVCMV